MHDGFEDEAQWSRLFIVHALGRTSDVRSVIEQFIGAEDSIVAAVRPFYGIPFSSSLSSMLHQRANDLIAIVTAQTASFTGSFEPNQRNALLANADAIAQLVFSVTPGLSSADLDADLRGSAQAMLDQIDARTSQNWTADVSAYEAGLGHDLATADRWTDAMVPQFQIQPSSLSASNLSLHFMLRQLFDDDAFWTRDAIIGQVIHTPDAPFAVQAAVSATDSIGKTFSTFLGSDVGLEVARQVHLVTITDAVAYMFALASGDTEAPSAIHTQWSEDANTLAQYLGQLNPSWLVPVVQRYTTVYEAETKAEIDARFASDFQADVDAYQAILGDARTLSVVFADGLGQAFLQ